MDVIKKFHEVDNMYESIEWAKAFSPAVKEGETKISDLVQKTKSSLVQIDTDIKAKIALNK